MIDMDPENLSTAEQVALLPPEEMIHALEKFSDEEIEALFYDWEFNARPKQKTPTGSWENWLILAGRGFGKTMTGAQTVRSWMCGPTPLAAGEAQYIALVAETSKDARDVMVEGPSGILACHPAAWRPIYEPSKSRLTWPNGSRAYIYNATEPNQLRGPQFDKAWLDEVAKFAHLMEMWDNLQFGLRKGNNPQAILTTTPRPLKFLRDLVNDPETFVTTGSSYENRANLTAGWFKKLKRKYEGTRLGRQELYAEIIDDNPYALWKLWWIDKHRKPFGTRPNWQEIVVAVDPPIKTGDDADECGIVVAGKAGDDNYYIIADASARGMSPDEWATKAISLARRHGASKIVAEVNQGGAMVEAVIKNVDPTAKVKSVHATKGKVLRAEPISGLYEQGRVHHIGIFATLEDQMTDFTSDFNRKSSGYSPDRLDALVWALTYLSKAGSDIEPKVRRL